MKPEVQTRWFVLVLLASAALVGSLGALAPSLPLSPLAAFAFAYLAVSTELLAFAWLAPKLSMARSVLICLAGVGALFALARVTASPVSAAELTIALGGSASVLGAAVGARIEKPGQLAAVALVSAIADVWSVFDSTAPSARFAEQVLAHPDQLALFALPFPLLGTPLLPAVIGAGDLVFAALYLSACRAHALSLTRVGLALVAALGLGLLILLFTLRPIPLLPLMGLLVLAVEPKARSLTGREWRTVLAVCAAMILAVGWRMSR